MNWFCKRDLLLTYTVFETENNLNCLQKFKNIEIYKNLHNFLHTFYVKI